jgi:CheY-like chemotaxis protein
MPSWRRVAQPAPAIYERWALTMPVISIIDDDESVREGIMDLFESVGFMTVAFPCASDFLSSHHLHDTSCLIAGVQMGGMTGFGLHNRLVGSGNIIPTILTTAYVSRRWRPGARCRPAYSFKSDKIRQARSIVVVPPGIFSWPRTIADTANKRRTGEVHGRRSRLRTDLAAHNALVP